MERKKYRLKERMRNNLGQRCKLLMERNKEKK